MTFPNSQSPQINLARNPFEPPLFVDMEAFFEFSFWITEELLDLEATHRLKNQRGKVTQAATEALAAIRL